MIEKISVENFKSHAHTEIELGRVTAIVGPNGSGKSSLLLAIQILHHLAKQPETHSITERFIGSNWNQEWIQKQARRETRDTSLSAEGREPHWKITTSLSGARHFEFENSSWSPGQRRFFSIDEDQPGPPQADWEALQEFGSAIYFKAISQSVALPSYTLDIPPQIGQDGSGLASVVAYLMTYLPDKHRLIEKDLKTIVPFIKRVRVHPAKIMIKEKRTISANGNSIAYDEDRQVVGHELLFDTTSGDGLPASMMSDGTLITLAVLSVLHTSDAKLIMFDDIEQGLHPLAQRQLMTTLKEFAQKHNKQILLTSHSPYIVDELEAKDVWVMANDKEGVSHCKRLSEHPDHDRAMQVLTTGEFLGAEGEDWVVPENVRVEEAHA